MVGVGFRLGCLVVSGLLVGQPLSVSASDSAVGFDVPTVVVAQSVHASALEGMHQGRYLRVQIPVSSYVSPSFEGQIDEYVVRVDCASQVMQVADFWPRVEQTTRVVGNVNVEETEKKRSDFGGNLSAGFQPFVAAGVDGKYHSENSLKQSYEKSPRLHTVSLAGLSNRGAGAFFKFRAGPNSMLEGARDLALLASVPETWRGDVFRVTMEAFGRKSNYDRSKKKIFRQDFWVAVYQEGDRYAASRARLFVRQEQSLRAMAATSQGQVERAAKPTVFHHIGAALDVMKPRIPDDYLSQVIFGPKTQYLEGHSHRLPLDLRIAILDFWEQRDAMFELANGDQPNARAGLLTAN
ncbi:MAG: hypothetical protein ACE361_14105 [Aureliella sp.]